MEFNDTEIVAQCISGNWESFNKLYEHYLPKIYQFVYYRTRHRQTAEDLTSAIFLKVVQNLGSYHLGSAPFAAWLYRIARNTVIDHSRTHKPTSDLEAAFNIASKDDVMGAADSAIKLEALKRGMRDLSDLQQQIMTMRVWDGLSHREIAEILDITEGSSKVAYSRAVTILKQTIETV